MKLLLSFFALVIVILPAGAFAEPDSVFSTEPKLPSRVVELEESWSVGGEDGEFIFGMMVDSLEDPEGNVYMLDAQLCHVEVFSPGGEHLRTISSQGDGPGEVRNPQNLVLFPDRTIGILELFPARFVTLSLDGEPRNSLVIGGQSSPQTGFSAALQATNRGGTILVAAQRSTPSDNGQSRTQYLARLSDSGEELARYREATMSLDFSDAKFVERELLPGFLLASTVDDEGRVYTARSRNEYVIEVYNPDGVLERVIEREFKIRKRDKDEMRRLNALVDAWMTGFPGEMERHLDAHEPPIIEMHVDGHGVLWVLNSRSGSDQPNGVFLTYDTFSPDGVWLQEVSFKVEANPVYDGIKFLGGDRVLLIKGYVLARWASRGAQNVDFGEDEEVAAMEITYCRMVEH